MAWFRTKRENFKNSEKNWILEVCNHLKWGIGGKNKVKFCQILLFGSHSIAKKVEGWLNVWLYMVFFPQKRTWKIKNLKKEVILEVFCP